ncbi:MAG: pectate lyase [Verrucomicrobiota bacterium]
MPAFPGAEGHGSDTVGGRGGRIIEVTNLNDSGDGSLRAACEASGPRTVVFRVGGLISLKDLITINDPYITIAGQTAPGDGIQVRGAHIKSRTHDVIIRGMRFRVGDLPEGYRYDNRDCMDLGTKAKDVYNIIVDRCSFSWSVDELVSLWFSGTYKITLQYCIFSEALYESFYSKGAHSRGLLVGDHAKSISVHHNLFVHNAQRNPMIKGDVSVEVINNLIYNWQKYCIQLDDWEQSGKMEVNIIGNHAIEGPDTKQEAEYRHAVFVRDRNSADSRMYIKDNIGPFRPTNTGDDWEVVYGAQPSHRSDKPIAPESGITIHPTAEVKALVLAHAGATAPKRDSVDQRIVSDVKNKTGKIINSQKEVGGWPSFRAGTPPVDSDKDGMPDEWETAHGLNPQDPSDRNQDLKGDGYTAVEVYLNSLFDAPSKTM